MFLGSKSPTWFFVGLMLWCSSAAAQEIWVEGGLNCGTWVKTRTEHNSSNLEDYVVGFLNGLALGAKLEFWHAQLPDLQREQAYLWLDNYCRANPLSQASGGIVKLFHERAVSIPQK